jgi:transposase-like protein
MPAALARDPIYRGRRFAVETIELCVRWYLTYRLSYRDLAAMMAERGIVVSHSTILRWVQRYVPEYERRWVRFARPVVESWRMDETAVTVGGQHSWLYRAVDRNGKTVHSLLRANRDIESAQAFFRGAVARREVPWPTTVNLDGNIATHRGLQLMGEEDPRWKQARVRTNRYLNNLIEQDHRAVKRRCAAMLGLKSFGTAAITLAGIELAHRIRKQQFELPIIGNMPRPSIREWWECALRPPSQPQPAVDGDAPPLHQNSAAAQQRTEFRQRRRSVRRHFSFKVPLGENLYLFVAPNGGRYWRYRYSFRGKQKILALGVYPDVSLARARTRRENARRLLSQDIDPSTRKKEVRFGFGNLIGAGTDRLGTFKLNNRCRAA